MTDDVTSHTARVEPAGIEVKVRPRETLFDAAWREGYRWPTLCYGQMKCTFCHVRVLEGENQLSPAEPGERVMITRVSNRLYDADTRSIRLACQLHVAGDIVVEQRAFRGERRDDTGAWSDA
jgi:ferredoxin